MLYEWDEFKNGPVSHMFTRKVQIKQKSSAQGQN